MKHILLCLLVLGPFAVATVTAMGTKADKSSARYELPDDWALYPVKEQSCTMGSRDAAALDAEDGAPRERSDDAPRNRSENAYPETASKFFTWLTGNVELSEYEPIGEVANYFGFAALRTEIRDRTDSQGDVQFRGTIYRKVLQLLDESQRAVLYELAEKQRPQLEGFLSERVNLVRELWALKEGKAIDYDRVTELMTSIGRYEGAITVTAAQYFTKLTSMMRDDQLQYLRDVRSGKIAGEELRNATLAYAEEADAQFGALNDFDQDMMQEIASKVISWNTSEVDDAIFLPPGKIGNYFGFANYRYVDRAAVTRGGAAQLVHDNLNEEQRAIMCDLSWQIVGFTNAYIEGRAELISALFDYRDSPANMTIDAESLINRYAQIAGVGEGRRAVVEALAFDLIESTMGDEQKAVFQSLRVESTTEAKTNAGSGSSGGMGGGGMGGMGGGGNGGGGMGGMGGMSGNADSEEETE